MGRNLQSKKYTFVFTGNSGHEHAFAGAHQYLETAAPPPAKTRLWLHLGAGAATLKWLTTDSGLVKQSSVDENRRFFYSSEVRESFLNAFDNIAGEKIQEKNSPGGELLYVAQKGYTRFAGITYAHPFFHVPTDNAGTTSPEILETTANAFRQFIEKEIASSGQVTLNRFEKNPIITAGMLKESDGDDFVDRCEDPRAVERSRLHECFFISV